MSNSQRKYPQSRQFASQPAPAHPALPEPVLEPVSNRPFELNDCDRIELKLAAQRRSRMTLCPCDQVEADFIDRMIATCGYAVKAIGTGECSHPGCDGGFATDPYSYTIGRAFFGLAELVTTGLNARDALRITNLVGQQTPWLWEPGVELVLDGQRFRLDAVDQMWIDCDEARLSSWFVDFARFHRPTVDRPEVWQIVWADGAGNFPDESGCEQVVVDQQPLLALDPIGYPPVDVDLDWQMRYDAS